MHEHTQKHQPQVERTSDRNFGFVFAAFFAILALYPLIRGQAVHMGFLAASGVLAIIAVVFPKVLAPTNWLWMKFGGIMHRIMSPVILAVLFYLLIFPTALIKRLFGGASLDLRFDRDATSYWIKRDPPGPSADSFNNQF